MKKVLLVLLGAIAIFAGIITANIVIGDEENEVIENETNEITLSEKVEDECIEEYNAIEEQEVEAADSKTTEKVSPNAIITFNTFYSDCEHTVSKYEKVKSNLVNATQEELEKEYDLWELQGFSEKEIVLNKETKGSCGEHYMLRDVDGMINIYKLDEKGNETLLEETEIATEYLTETDMIDMENGLIVYGKESLNMLLEDFE